MLGTKWHVSARASRAESLPERTLVRHASEPSLRAEIPEYARREHRPGYVRVLCHRGDSFDVPKCTTLGEVIERAADKLLGCARELVDVHYPTSKIPVRKTGEPLCRSSEPFADTHFLENSGVRRQYENEQHPYLPHIPSCVWAPLKLKSLRRVSDMLLPCGMEEGDRLERTAEVSIHCPLDTAVGQLLPPDGKYLLATCVQAPITVHVRTYAHRTVTLQRVTQVADVKRAIHLQMGIGPERQRLFHKGHMLQEDAVLVDEGVPHEGVLILGDTIRHSRYYAFEKAQSRRPHGCSYPRFPPLQGPPKHELSVSVANWVGFEQWKGSMQSLASAHDRDWTMNLSRDELWPTRLSKTWLNANNVY